MANTLTIDPAGTPVVLDEAGRIAHNVSLVRLIAYRRSGIPSLSFIRLLGGKAPTNLVLFDPWDGKQVKLEMSAASPTMVFAGDIVGHSDRYLPHLGWVRDYECAGLVKRADYIPVTDPNTNTDQSIWNSSIDDPSAIVAREGQTVGAIVTEILQDKLNARLLHDAGIGNYTVTGSPPTDHYDAGGGTDAYTLPSSTVSDLARLTFIPQGRVMVGGERILQSIEGMVQQFHPNHCLHVEPAGDIRFLDQSYATHFPSTTLTLGSDARLDMPEIHTDYSECYGQVEVRGETLVKAVEVSTAGTSPGLTEDFAWGSYSSSAAKAAWTPADWQDPTVLDSTNHPKFGDTGSLTSVTTTTVDYTSDNAATIWPIHYWENSGSNAFGWIIMRNSSLSNQMNEYFSAKITGCPAMTAGATVTLTLDRPLPVTSYTKAQIYGLAAGPTVVYTRYKVANTALAAAMVNFFPYPVPYVSPTGLGAVMTNAPMATVMLTQGSNHYSMTVPFTFDPSTGNIYFAKPTALVFGGGISTPPTEVRVLLAVADPAGLKAYAPATTSDGTVLATPAYIGTGADPPLSLTRRKIITVHDWKDYGTTNNQTSMATFAKEWLNSAKDVVFEGTVPYHGLIAGMLNFGNAVTLTGSDFTTGLESIPLPVIEAILDFHEDETGATSYTMALNCSNRRQRYSADVFTKPPLRPHLIGFESPVTTANIEHTISEYQRLSGLGEGFQEALGGPATPEGEPFLWGPAGPSGGQPGPSGPETYRPSAGVVGSWNEMEETYRPAYGATGHWTETPESFRPSRGVAGHWTENPGETPPAAWYQKPPEGGG